MLQVAFDGIGGGPVDRARVDRYEHGALAVWIAMHVVAIVVGTERKHRTAGQGLSRSLGGSVLFIGSLPAVLFAVFWTIDSSAEFGPRLFLGALIATAIVVIEARWQASPRHTISETNRQAG